MQDDSQTALLARYTAIIEALRNGHVIVADDHDNDLARLEKAGLIERHANVYRLVEPDRFADRSFFEVVAPDLATMVARSGRMMRLPVDEWSETEVVTFDHETLGLNLRLTVIKERDTAQ